MKLNLKICSKTPHYGNDIDNKTYFIYRDLNA